MDWQKIRYIAFDADDTLWSNEPLFQRTEEIFCRMMEEYGSAHCVSEVLFKVEMQNLAIYGYGIKGFVLSMLETALRISDKRVSQEMLMKIIELGQNLLNAPVELLPDTLAALRKMSSRYKLVVATKGDLLDQERKLKKSGLLEYFHHVEIMTEKDIESYRKLLNHLEVSPDEFLMVGNSLRSDIMPVLELGGAAVYIPFHVTWQHEMENEEFSHENLMRLRNLDELTELIRK